MNTTKIGRQAEAQAATYLESLGYTIIEQNWRTRYCEIDIVARKAEIIYFVEVKHRSSIQQGSGFDYITSAKQRQMRFAADFWVATHNWTSTFELAAAEVGLGNVELVLI